MSLAKNAALIALGAVGAYAAINQISKPSKAAGIASAMRSQLDDYNTQVHPEQDRSDTIFDRTAQMNAAKEKKPWNRTYAESFDRQKHVLAELPSHWVDELRRMERFADENYESEKPEGENHQERWRSALHQ